MVEVREGSHRWSGTARAVTPGVALVVDTGKEERVVTAADVRYV